MSQFKGNFLDTLGSFVPGYKGYKEREGRRDTDRLLREAIVKRLNDRKNAVDRVIGDFSRQMKFDALETLELAKRRIEKITDMIRHAPSGYSGIFDTLQIREEDLDKIYRHDLGLRDLTEKTAEQLGQLGTAKEPVAAVEALLATLQELEETVRGRDKACTEIR